MIKCKNPCLLGKFDGCCHCCPEFGSCGAECSEKFNDCGEAIIDGDSGMELFQATQMTILNDIADLVTQKKKLEAAEKKLKDELKGAMEQYGIKKFSSDILDITYVAEATSTSLDSTRLKKEKPDVYAAFTKTSKKSAYVKVTVKEGDK